VADKNIEGYKSNNFDSDYGDTSFFIFRGNILAIEELPTLLIENDKVNTSNLPSIFDIRPDLDSDVMKFGLNDNRIMVDLPKELYAIRNAFNNNLQYRNMMNSMIVLPVLVAVLKEMSSPDSIPIYGDQRWFSIISKKLKKLEIDVQSDD